MSTPGVLSFQPWLHDHLTASILVCNRYVFISLVLVDKIAQDFTSSTTFLNLVEMLREASINWDFIFIPATVPKDFFRKHHVSESISKGSVL